MLPLALVRASARGEVLRPRWIDPSDPELLEVGEALIATFRAAAEAGRTRGELDQEVEELAELIADRKLFDGLAKLCADRTESAMAPDVDPAALRAEVFRLARERGPVAFEAGPLGAVTADDLLAEAGRTRGLSGERMAALLYAD